MDAIRWQYTHGVAEPEAVSPDGYTLDAALMQRPGNAEVQLDLFKDYASNVQLYPEFQRYLREQKPPIFTNRDCIQKTFLDKGLPYISSLALENTRALAGVIQWNHENGIRFFRCAAGSSPVHTHNLHA